MLGWEINSASLKLHLVYYMSGSNMYNESQTIWMKILFVSEFLAIGGNNCVFHFLNSDTLPLMDPWYWSGIHSPSVWVIQWVVGHGLKLSSWGRKSHYRKDSSPDEHTCQWDPLPKPPWYQLSVLCTGKIFESSPLGIWLPLEAIKAPIIIKFWPHSPYSLFYTSINAL